MHTFNNNCRMETPVIRRTEGERLVDFFDQAITSVDQLIYFAHRNYAKNEYLGVREFIIDGSRGEYAYKSYGEVISRATKFSNGLRRNYGLVKGDRVAIVAESSIEWIITFLACALGGFVFVPVYTTFSFDEISQVFNRFQVKICVASSKMIKADKILALTESCACLATIIACDKVPSEYSAGTRKMADIEESGAYSVDSEMKVVVLPSDDAIVLHTAGTTGDPKSILLTHAAMMAQVAAVADLGVGELSEDDTYFSYMELATANEIFVQLICLYCGGSVGFPTKGMAKWEEDLYTLSPSLMIMVPRVANILYRRMIASVASGNVLYRKSFWSSYDRKREKLSKASNTPWLNFFIFNSILESVGMDRLRCVVFMYGYLHQKIQNFFKITTGAHIVAAHGLSESFPVFFGEIEGTSVSAAAVGKPLPHSEFKLRSHAESGFLVSDTPRPRGLLLVHSNSGKKSRGADPATPGDSFINTGDLAEVADGVDLIFAGRADSMIYMENVAPICPEEVEAAYSICKYVDQIFVFKNEQGNQLEALIVPNREDVLAWGGSEPYESLIEMSDLKDAIFREIGQYQVEEGLETELKKIYLDSEEWTVKSGYLSHNFSLRRGALLQKLL